MVPTTVKVPGPLMNRIFTRSPTWMPLPAAVLTSMTASPDEVGSLPLAVLTLSTWRTGDTETPSVGAPPAGSIALPLRPMICA